MQAYITVPNLGYHKSNMRFFQTKAISCGIVSAAVTDTHLLNQDNLHDVILMFLWIFNSLNYTREDMHSQSMLHGHSIGI